VLAAATRPAQLIDLSTAGLAGLTEDHDGLRLGATTAVAALTELPQPWGALSAAAAAFRPQVVREQGTVGGNVLVGGSLMVPLVLLQAEVELASVHGRRRLALSALPASGALQVTADELVVALHVPRAGVHRSSYGAICRVPLGPALVSVAIAVSIAGPRLAVRAGGPRVQCFGPSPTDDLIAKLEAEIDVHDDAAAGARYRAAMAGVLAGRLLRAPVQM
jgi:CO/xanthine dehydrogenase FAD-binding subunit